MADIELVIKIPIELYDMIQDKLDFNGDLKQKDIKTLMLSIDDGKPLPKGHGDLVDISPYRGKVICSHLYSGVKKLIEVDSIEPIIEADRPGNKEADGIRPKAGTPREDYEPEYGR